MPLVLDHRLRGSEAEPHVTRRSKVPPYLISAPGQRRERSERCPPEFPKTSLTPCQGWSVCRRRLPQLSPQGSSSLKYPLPAAAWRESPGKDMQTAHTACLSYTASRDSARRYGTDLGKPRICTAAIDPARRSLPSKALPTSPPSRVRPPHTVTNGIRMRAPTGRERLSTPRDQQVVGPAPPVYLYPHNNQPQQVSF